MQGPRRITATHVYQYMLCEHTAWRTYHADPKAQVPPHEGLRLRFELGDRHEARVTEPLGWPEPSYAVGDWAAGREATRALLASGVDGVLQGVLLDGDLLGKPDLLRREPGASELGDFHYVAGDVKSSARPKGEQVMQVAFYARLLTAVQGKVPDTGYIVLGDGSTETFEIAPFLVVLDGILAELREIRDADRRPPLHLSDECAGCGWRIACRADAEAARDLSLVPGIARGMAALLRKAAVGTVEEAAAVDPDTLAAETLAEREVLDRIRRRARAVVRDAPAVLSVPEIPPGPEGLYLVGAEDPRRPGALVVLGWDAVDAKGRARREVRVAPDGDGERESWRHLLQRLVRRSGPPIFHAGGLAPGAVERLQAVHGGDPAAFGRLHDTAHDLSQMLRRSVALPTPASGLRAFAHVVARGAAGNGEAGGGPSTPTSGTSSNARAEGAGPQDGIEAEGPTKTSTATDVEGTGKALAPETPAGPEAVAATPKGTPAADPFDDGPGREAHYGGSFGHYFPWHERWIATGDDAWREKIERAVHAELDALRALHSRLVLASERSRARRAGPKRESTRPHGSRRDGARRPGARP